jgi:uncharacterized Zn finger protein
MSNLPRITEKAILKRVGERSFKLGQRYAEDGSVFNCRRQGLTLKARCQGTADEPYRVEVTFDQKADIADAECSCPVGDGGYCKHVAAVLLTWRRRPDGFTETEEVGAALARRSKEELVALVQEMLKREPDLESLLELPLPGGPRPAEVSPEAFRRQAVAAFGRGGYEWGAARAIADDLSLLMENADAYLEQQDFDAAAAARRH